MEYPILVSGNAPLLYPTETLFGLLWYNENEALEIPKAIPFCAEWGEVLSYVISLREEYPIPYKLNILWLSIVERKFYELESQIAINDIEALLKIRQNKDNSLFSHIVVGMAPYGNIAIWVRGFYKSVLVQWLKGKRVDIKMTDFLIDGPNISLDKYCDFYINNNLNIKQNIDENGLPPLNLFEKYMQQFTYRYLPVFEVWDEDEGQWNKYKEGEEKIPNFEYIEESLYDGTHDKLHDGGLLKYHVAGKPKKIAVKWHIKKSEYTAYFWFDETLICEIFEKFYGAHKDTKVDFIIRIDAEQKKYELSLYRYGLKEPLIIPEEAYQLLVFKSKFEHYHSKNYDQESNTWIW